jgi:hypothetical protein
MPEELEIVADALDASIVTESASTEPEDERVALAAAVDSAQRKVAKQQEHLAGAQAALEAAQAALAALDGGVA